MVVRFKKWVFFRTIKFKLSALFCSITIALCILVGITFFDYKKKSIFSQFKEHADTLVQNLAVNAGAALLGSDEMQLSVLVFTELKKPGVMSAAILDHEGRALIHSDINEIGQYILHDNPAEDTFKIQDRYQQEEIRPILVNGKKVGSALMTIDSSSVYQNADTLKKRFVTGALIFCGFGCFLIIHIVGKFLEPLGSLSQAAVKVGYGDLNVRVRENGGEEIRNLGRVFNKMTDGLAHANQQIEEGYLQSVMALSAAVEAKDPYTRGHCDRVAYYAEQVALYMKMDQEIIKKIILAGQLHDLGKIGVDTDILCKPGRLDPEEFDHITRHPVIAWQILEPAVFLSSVRDIIIVHHERYDGKGYPHGLSGDQISLAGKILAIADCYDAMTSNRPYRKHMGEEKALRILEEEKGKQFDPEVVNAFINAHPRFKDRETLDKQLEISSRGRVWVYDEVSPVNSSTDIQTH